MSINKHSHLSVQPKTTSTETVTAQKASLAATATQKSLEKRPPQKRTRSDDRIDDRKYGHGTVDNEKTTSATLKPNRQIEAKERSHDGRNSPQLTGIYTGIDTQKNIPKALKRGTALSWGTAGRFEDKHPDVKEPWAEHHLLSKVGRQERLEKNREKSEHRLSKAQRRMLEEDLETF